MFPNRFSENIRCKSGKQVRAGARMVSYRVSQAVRTAAVSLSFLFLFAIVAFAQPAQDREQNQPGQFDFYVLALSWSPSFCEASQEREQERGQERNSNRGPDPQCGGRSFSFVVHGLWPQYEHGFPSFCQVPSPRLYRGIVDRMLDLMPSPRLVFHEWDRHGTCSGLSANAFFESVRKARAVMKIPPNYLELDKPMMVTPEEVTDAFVKANPGLSRASLAVTCDRKRLEEVWVCMGKDFSFHDCPEVTRRACKRDKIAMPAVRGS
jgi:ribonuclease T2